MHANNGTQLLLMCMGLFTQFPSGETGIASKLVCNASSVNGPELKWADMDLTFPTLCSDELDLCAGVNVTEVAPLSGPLAGGTRITMVLSDVQPDERVEEITIGKGQCVITNR